ncbi:MAG TPA: hypothetical protein VIR33_12895 [Thermopolyspora sp.]
MAWAAPGDNRCRFRSGAEEVGAAWVRLLCGLPGVSVAHTETTDGFVERVIPGGMGTEIAFAHPRSFGGALVEFVQVTDETEMPPGR